MTFFELLELLRALQAVSDNSVTRRELVEKVLKELDKKVDE